MKKLSLILFLIFIISIGVSAEVSDTIYFKALHQWKDSDFNNADTQTLQDIKNRAMFEINYNFKLFETDRIKRDFLVYQVEKAQGLNPVFPFKGKKIEESDSVPIVKSESEKDGAALILIFYTCLFLIAFIVIARSFFKSKRREL